MFPYRFYHPFLSFYLARSRERRQRIFIRDGAAVEELGGVAEKLGCRRGRTLLNYPPSWEEGALPNPPVAHMDLSGLDPSHLIGIAGRPLVRQPGDRRSRSQLGHTSLEALWIERLSHYLRKFYRDHMVVQERLHSLLKPGYETRREIYLGKRPPSPYQEFGRVDDAPREVWRGDATTVAVLLFEPEIVPGGPGLLSAFGWDDYITAVWASRLREDFTYLFDTHCFVMAELSNGSVRERPTDMSFAGDWRVEIILHEQLDQPRGSRRVVARSELKRSISRSGPE